MAISKIKPIKKTLKKAIDYIMNAEKTDGGRLVSSFGCTPMTADIEMQMTEEQALNKSERKAYHLLQSFSPDDNITPEKAHELGRQFADQLLEGKYEYVIATHIDKGHIHNHIIFNATSFVDYKKYHMPVWHKYRMFNINDRICRENHLSVIENPSAQKGKSWYEKKMSDEGKSWMEKIKIAIDDAIQKADSYEEFIVIMEMEGYEYKETAKTLGFKCVVGGQEKFTRVNEKNFGEYYTKEMLLKRIADKDFDRSIDKSKKKMQKSKTGETIKSKKIPVRDGKINLIIDISKNIKAQQSKGYEHALVMANINTMVQTMNYLQKNGMETLDELNHKMQEAASLLQSVETELKNTKKQRRLLAEKIKFSQNYVKYKKIAARAKKEPVGSEYLKEYRNEILSFNVAALYMENNKIDTSYLDIKQMIAEYKEYLEKEKMTQLSFKEMREKVKELETVKRNVEQILNTGPSEKEESRKKENTKTVREENGLEK